MKITFTNVKIAYGGCDCCGDDTVYDFTPGPFVIETPNEDVSIETHAKIAFGAGVIEFEYAVEK
jgi:hypothetical protein